MRPKTNYAECPSAFKVERIGEHSALVTFAENAAEIENGENTAWNADAYELVTAWTPTLAARIEADYAAWFAHAKDLDYDKAAVEVRKKRDELISATDYLVAADYPITAERRTAIETYRQALRDVPEQIGFPYDVVWEQGAN